MSIQSRILIKNASAVTWLLISALFVIPIGGHAIGGLLLCLEGDGQVEFELATGLRCNEFLDPGNHSTDLRNSEIDALSSTDHDCGSCIDILLLRTGDTDCGAIQLKPFAYPQLVAYVPLGSFDTRLFPKTPPRNSHLFSGLTLAVDRSEIGTVVLLI